jgi:2-oxoisovalerate dehydrogenase E1 component
MGIKYLGTDEVVYVSAGEGTTAQGAYHEALNWAAREKLPIIFVIQDNQYAISVHVSEHIAGSSVEGLSSGYDGIEVKRINGLDFKESFKASKDAVKRARKGEGPTVLIADVVRLQSHSISDNQSKYRDKKDIEKDQKKDPLLLLEKVIIKEKILSKKELEALKIRTQEAIDEASSWADNQQDPDPDTALEYILADTYPGNNPEPEPESEPEFMVDALNKALHEEMAHNEKMVVYGQDVGYGKGGVFSVTAGLTNAFGANRCFNSPLAEDSIVGTAVGLAAVGYKPVVEIQFGDYIWTAMMQIRNELAALYYRSKGDFSCPAVIRVAVGGYIRGALYHSQNIEATFAHFPGLVVIYPSNATDAKGLLKSAIRSKDPVLFLEHKGLYRQVYAKGPLGSKDDCTPIGKAKVVREGTDATIISWGALVYRALGVADELSEEGIHIEVIDLRTLSPLDTETIFESVRKTNRVLIAHEDIEFMGFGSEVAALVGTHCFPSLDAPVQRVAAKFSMIPQAPNLESIILPSKKDVLEATRTLLSY